MIMSYMRMMIIMMVMILTLIKVNRALNGDDNVKVKVNLI